MNGRTIELLAPVSGRIHPMKEIPDPVFAEGILGMCCGIEPEEESIYAPADGKITYVADTRHALGLALESGLELMIHVGIDTVEMNGKGFRVLVKPKEQVKKGQKLLEFSRKAIEEAGHSDMVVYAVTNAEDGEDVRFAVDGGKIGRLEKAGEALSLEKNYDERGRQLCQF